MIDDGVFFCTVRSVFYLTFSLYFSPILSSNMPRALPCLTLSRRAAARFACARCRFLPLNFLHTTTSLSTCLFTHTHTHAPTHTHTHGLYPHTHTTHGYSTTVPTHTHTRTHTQSPIPSPHLLPTPTTLPTHPHLYSSIPTPTFCPPSATYFCSASCHLLLPF